MCSIDVPEVADLEGLAPRELASVLAALDGARRRLDAAIAETVGIAERTVAYAEDGHASISGWAKATCNWSSSGMCYQASRLVRLPTAGFRSRPLF